MKKIAAISVVIGLILGSIRGIIVINTDISSKYVYLATSTYLLLLSVIGFMQMRQYKSPHFTLLKNLLRINLILGILYIPIEYYLGAAFDFGLFYIFLAPFVLFAFMRTPSSHLRLAFLIITLAICYSIYDNYTESLQGLAGYQNVVAYNLKLRPETFSGLSHTNDIFRVGGYTGDYHDSANILGMCLSYFFITFLLKRKMSDLAIFLVALKCITLTQSAANIILTIFTLMIFTALVLIKEKKIMTYFYFAIGAIAVLSLIMIFGNAMSVFIERVGLNGDWKGMVKQLDSESIINGLPFALFGHVYAFSSNVIETEMAFLKTIYQFGLINALIFFSILLYPVFHFFKRRAVSDEALPSLAAIFFGFLSLLHYASLLRVTSIFLFFAFYTICLKSISTYPEELHENS